ncbi:unnamed protein product [Cylicocyclus nassatus]|uniref:Uncharacterized protein n=1 Tax=Cylicocyclus nassatus TaxID=53992 RepID=A0AA36GG21_CYLNA|nr:unnamed protein product [Cylicocyclus nassatus]
MRCSKLLSKRYAVRNTFFAFVSLHFIWAAWVFTFSLMVYMKGDVATVYIVLLSMSTVLNCAGCAIKVVVFSNRSYRLAFLCVQFLVIKVILDAMFWFVIVVSFDIDFGLHFYYDTTLLTTVLSSLDMVLFPNFLLAELERLQKKRN